jgi:hypothetical protein
MAKLGDVLTRLDRGRLPVHVTPIARRFVETLASELGPPRWLVLRALLQPRPTACSTYPASRQR